MTAEILLRGQVVTPDRLLPDGWILIRGENIVDLGEGAPPVAETTLDYRPGYLVPGLIDLHLHGLEHGDPASEEGIQAMLEAAPRHGLTGIVPALASATHEEYLNFFGHARAAAEKASRAARLLGVHCEGPHINPAMARGMDPDFLRPPDPREDDELLERGRDLLRIMTLSPELPGSEALIAKLRESGVVASIGHSAATREQIRRAIRAGATHVCHWPNALPKRDREPHLPDTASFCLESPELTLELILDLVHVPPEKIRLAREKAGIRRLVGVTDGMRGAGLKGGTYRMTDGRIYCIWPDGSCRLVDSGVLVGTATTLSDGLRNLVKRLGFSLLEAAQICSINPARVIGLGDRYGQLRAGFAADIVVFDEALQPVATFVGGSLVWKRDANVELI